MDRREGRRNLSLNGAPDEAAQQRPEPDADLAALDPRRLGLVRWAGDEMTWEPISRELLFELIAKDLAEATAEERAKFSAAATSPAKWQLSPWGDLGGGFWVVAATDDRVLWYNDIEDGFNVSSFVTHGRIPSGDYWCNQGNLLSALPALAGCAQGKFGPPRPLP